MTTAFASKVFNGELATTQDWVDYLQHAHLVAPGMTPDTYAICKTAEGFTPYNVLVNAIRLSTIPVSRILDLACGDGYLLSLIDKSSDRELSLVGIDMSEGELAEARKKTFSNHTLLKREMAQKLTESSESFDAIVSHMAFMLMTPIEPVVAEIHRVLKPGGMFAAVIGGDEPATGFYGDFRRLFKEHVAKNHPKFLRPEVGDSRIDSREGIRQVLRPERFADLKTHDFVAQAEFHKSQIWNVFKDYYFISALPRESSDLFRETLLTAAADVADSNDKLKIDFRFRLITALKI